MGNPFSRLNRRHLTTLSQWISRDLALVCALIVILFSLWGFVELADNVLEEETNWLDHYLLLSMRNPADHSDPLGPEWLEEVGRDITALGGNAVLIMITLIGVGYLLLERKAALVIVLITATAGALIASHSLKAAFDRDRPDVVPHQVVVYSQSFPSGHSMLSAATYLTVGALLSRAQRRKRIKFYIVMVAITITFLVGISRIYLGVHWPTDVLAGWVAGGSWALICWLLARHLQARNASRNNSCNGRRNDNREIPDHGLKVNHRQEH